MARWPMRTLRMVPNGCVVPSLRHMIPMPPVVVMLVKVACVAGASPFAVTDIPDGTDHDEPTFPTLEESGVVKVFDATFVAESMHRNVLAALASINLPAVEVPTMFAARPVK